MCLRRSGDDVNALDELGDENGWGARLQGIVDDLGEHMYKENFGLSPAALATLDGTDWDDMDAEDSAPTQHPAVR
jgi:hypothetical protein